MKSPLLGRLAVVLLVLTPGAWVVLTEDGRRNYDILVSRLAGHPKLSLDLRKLDRSLDEDLLRRSLHDLEFRCRDNTTDFGDRSCVATLAAFNGIPARYVTLFYANRQLQAMKLAYRPRYHPRLITAMTRQLGQAQAASRDDNASAATRVQEWRLSAGVVATASALPADATEGILLWVGS